MKHPACDWLEAVCDIAREAGRRILEIYETAFSVEHKEDKSPLTAADMASHRIIKERLARLTPDIPILTEESAEVPYEERARWERFWLVDPLDGTKEFIKRNGEFTVNIALVEGDRPVLGVVYVPVTGVCYLACRGGGAYRQDPGQPPRPIRVRPYRGGKVVVAGSRSHAGPRLRAFLENLGDYELVSMGSALKACLVAEGKADIYPRLGPTSEWDTAAAQCVVEEAGGHVTDLEGRPLRYNKPSLINPEFIVFGDDRVDWTRFLPEPATPS